MWVAAIGQAAFVVLWASMPWWRTWIGRALMTKSVFLCLILWFWISGLYFPDFDHRDAIRRTLIFGVTAGILFQTVALYAEIHLSKRRPHAAAKP